MIEVSTIAVEKLKETLLEQGSESAALRVIAVPEEQGGVQYMLSVEKESQEDDTELQVDGLKLVMDSTSQPFLEDATIDFVEDLTRTGFVISNPKFQQGCACGGNCGCGGGDGGGGGCGGH